MTITNNAKDNGPYVTQLIPGKDATCFLRINQVLELVPVSRSSLYDMVRDGRFPKQVKLSANVSVWRRADVDAYIKSVSGKSAEDKGATSAEVASHE
jgi:predicted DNA-binding transcriptional regulator AlpA